MGKETIKTVLQSRGLTMADMARGTGLSLSYISRVISGERRPRLDNATKMAMFLGISMERLVRLLP